MISPQRQWRYRICPAQKCFRVKPRILEAAGPIRIIGPGTGLGVSALIPEGRKWAMVVGEGGHFILAEGVQGGGHHHRSPYYGNRV
jgi:Glucokinase